MRTAAYLLGGLVLGACRESETDVTSPNSVLVAANVAKDRAMIAGDAAALDRFYTADYQVIDAYGKVHDKRNQVEFITKAIDVLEAESVDVRVNMLAKNAAMITGRMRGRYRQSGKEKPFDERYTSIWINEDSHWRVRHEHSSRIDASN